jgi:hypothetical protein
VHLAVVGARGARVRSAQLPGSRAEVRAGAVDLALRLLREELTQLPTGPA